MSISQRDLAKHLGLSPMTISLALRNSPRLPIATRERVQMAANELGYKPNPALAALNNHRRDRMLKTNNATLAFITNWQDEFGWRKSYVNFFYQGAVSRAAQCGYTLVPFWLKAYKSYKRASDVLYNRGIRGLVSHHWKTGRAK
ncbi:LacI family DNA-binding transcriptional regulator [Coraliomargarita algicola]|uniref:LacI family DNA-binding transcriptional regulator n=1 Tax=Coraliomargarita algicola TaxID=3092156 RepID=A0ABZ0RL92_9BACT|nr:LacI family DNA-binding transcriptional regulator [Coraliomargarita sp. J2-16]WPJ96297.1 LacI family DNA-binding transcriptional regulator [Coraliomargarita sp. J2-16]